MSPALPAHISDALTAQILRLSAAAGGQVGVAAAHLSTGIRFVQHGSERFPMASTFKVALAGAVLQRIDAGVLRLDGMFDIPPGMRVGSDGIDTTLPYPGLSVSVRNLLEVTLTQSDNTATDVLMEAVGGASAVTAWLRSIGVQAQRVDRNTAALIRDFFGLPAQLALHQPERAALQASAPDPRADLPNPAYDDDPRDTSTPDAMLELLRAIGGGTALSTSSTRLLLDILSRCATGDRRLRGLLPPQTRVAHKTGTLGGTVNDVGFITLPDASQLALAIFVKKSTQSPAVRERAIAEIARTLYDACVLMG
jgi:beta-lactamase class A